ncbi:MAG: secondary thiamine-phosphate synthase enzyme YjbQ [Bdellovibrionales bacterium]|nr:secondary thiamine-phosphate synthase enzyme YjbQ [Bdellovibrionales bacterium]
MKDLTPNHWLLSPHEFPGYQRHELRSHEKRAAQVHHTEWLHFTIPKRYALVNATEKIEEVIERSEVTDGLCFVSAMHITSGVYVNDAESGLLHDIAGWLNKLAPFGLSYLHHQTGEDNADAHLKSFLTNHSLTAPITEGRLDFGTWQQIFYGEYDGNRPKRLLVKVLGIQ